MLEMAVEARRGSFHLKVECRLTAPWTVIFGPSGAGKTTLLRALAGLERSSGHIALNGKAIGPLRAGARRVGMVTQQPALFPHLSVKDNVGYGLPWMGSDEREEVVRAMLALAGASDLAERRTAHLSGGEAQRVALARALAPRPRLLLLDEPFSALDGTASDELLERLQVWLREQHVQTIQATHDATDAFFMQAEVVLMREGGVQAQGPASEVLDAERKRLMRSLDANQKPSSTGSISS